MLKEKQGEQRQESPSFLELVQFSRQTCYEAKIPGCKGSVQYYALDAVSF